MPDLIATSNSIVGVEPLGERYQRVYVWQWPIRIFHWVNAAAILTLFTTGLYIAFPVFTSNGEAYQHFVMGRFRQVHFAAGFVFAVSFVWRTIWFFIGNEYARSGFPYVWRVHWWKDLFSQAFDYLRLKFGEPHLGHNALAGIFYTFFIIFLGLLQLLTGFALYGESSPGGFWDSAVGWALPLFGGPMRTLMWHHLFAWGFIIFTILHVYIVILDAGQYRNGLIVSMITGMKFKQVGEEDGEG